jgi:hypothetical protein
MKTRKLLFLREVGYPQESRIPLIPQFRGTPMAREHLQPVLFSVHQEIQTKAPPAGGG